MKYQDFPLIKKSYLHRAQWRYFFYLSRVRILVSPWLLTWLANYKRASRSGARGFFWNFISINKINKTLHGRLGTRILSTSAESISHEWASLQHSKIKFVSPSGHVISYISSIIAQVIVEMRTLWLVEHSVISRYNHLARGDYCRGAAIIENGCPAAIFNYSFPLFIIASTFHFSTFQAEQK